MRTGSPEPLDRTRCRGVGRATTTRPADDRPARAAAVGCAPPMRARGRAPVPALLSDGPLADSRPRPRTVPPGPSGGPAPSRPSRTRCRSEGSSGAVLPGCGSTAPSPVPGSVRPASHRADPPGVLTAASRAPAGNRSTGGPVGAVAVPARERPRAGTTDSPDAEALDPVTGAGRTSPVTAEAR
jgi:hypothetical protein